MIFLFMALLSIDTMLIGINLKQENIEIKSRNILLLSFISISFIAVFHLLYQFIVQQFPSYILGYFFIILACIYTFKGISDAVRSHKSTFDFNRNHKINVFETIILSVAISFDNACFLSIYPLKLIYLLFLFILNIVFIKLGIQLRKKIKWEKLLELLPILIFLYLGIQYLA